LVKHKAGVIALSDAGAHLVYLCDAGFGLYLLGHWVRERHCQLKPSWYALRVGGGRLGIWKREACPLSCPEIGEQGGKKASSAR
jgi:hypothetical protein